MATMRFQIQTALVAPFAQGLNYQFRIGFDKPDPSGGTRRVNPKNAPIITLKKAGGIVQTGNETAQKYLLNHIVPQNTFRSNSNAVAPTKRPSGFLFEDVTATTTSADLDVDLDQILV